MKVNNRWLAVLLLLSLVPLCGCGFISKLRARDNLNKGVRAFTEQKYDQAAQFFEDAIRQDPEFEVARMYLATTYTSQFVPGSPDPRSKEMANKAIATFTEVLDSAKDKSKPNINAMLSIASLYYQLKDSDKSKEWCRKILEKDPFASIDTEGVGAIVHTGVQLGRKTRKDLKIGICGEHGGDPASIHFFEKVGLDYVSASPYRVPVARLAAAQAALAVKVGD